MNTIRNNSNNERIFYIVDKTDRKNKHIKVTIEKKYLQPNFDANEYLRMYGSTMWFSRYLELLPPNVTVTDEL